MLRPEEIREAVLDNLHDATFNVEKLAEVLSVSTAMLYECCARHFEMSPHRLSESRRRLFGLRRALLQSNRFIRILISTPKVEK